MTWDRRSGTLHRARNAVNQLTARGIELPDSVAAAVAVLDRVQAAAPAPPKTTAVREAILAGADDSEIDRLLLADLAHTRLRSEHTQAVVIAAERVLAAVMAERDNLHAALKVLAEHAIEQLDRVASFDGASLEELVRAGRHDDAKALAEVEVVGAELKALYEIRDTYLTPGGPEARQAGHFDCSEFVDCRVGYRHHSIDRSVAGNYVYALRQGAELHYPTAEEALAAAAPIYAAWERDAARKAARQGEQYSSASALA
ncbi:MAG: hypothetical protein AB7I50_12590 [Vicinamibacterales bacterium]